MQIKRETDFVGKYLCDREKSVRTRINVSVNNGNPVTSIWRRKTEMCR
jgi:hypothetical protein